MPDALHPLAPFKLETQLKERVWGGSRLGTHAPPFGEAWLVFEENRITSGPHAGMTLAQLTEQRPLELLGTGPVADVIQSFPLLIKLLDPADWLSIQVHPDDDLALLIEGPGFRGKTEAWYVLEADPGAEIIAGVKPDIAAQDVAASIRNGSLDDLLDRHRVAPGDSILVNAGMIHALGPGVFIYEVQQSSDLTYRVSDWGRPASAGRQLHIDQSVQAARPDLLPVIQTRSAENGEPWQALLECEYFRLERFVSPGTPVERDKGIASFHVITAIDGELDLIAGDSTLRLERYESAIVPGATSTYRLEGVGPISALISSVP